MVNLDQRRIFRRYGRDPELLSLAQGSNQSAKQPARRRLMLLSDLLKISPIFPKNENRTANIPLILMLFPMRA